jgi:uncharacterized protein involved in propanediol utilization
MWRSGRNFQEFVAMKVNFSYKPGERGFVMGMTRTRLGARERLPGGAASPANVPTGATPTIGTHGGPSGPSEPPLAPAHISALKFYFDTMSETLRPAGERLGQRSCDRVVRDAIREGRTPRWLEQELYRRGVLRAEVESTSHVGELVQGAIRQSGVPAFMQDMRLPPTAPVTARFLIDLPAPIFSATVRLAIRPGNGLVISRPANRSKARKAASLLLTLLGIAERVDIEIDIASDIPEKRGLGSSSVDTRAVLLAIAQAFDLSVSLDLLDQLTVLAEGASNPGATYPTLFFHRLGFTAVWLPRFPHIWVLAFDDPAAEPVDTDRFEPAAYTVAQINDYELLAPATMRAIREGDVNGLGRASIRSASVNDEFLPRGGATALRELDRIRHQSQAAGYAVSHSGTVGALIYDARDACAREHVQAGARRLANLGCQIFTPYWLGG